MAERKLTPEQMREYGEFSQLAAKVLQSPYFYEKPPEKDHKSPSKVIAFREAKDKEQEVLEEALFDAQSLDDLSPQAKSIWDKALHALNVSADDEFFAERMGTPPIFQMPAEVANQLSPEESNLLTLAMIECAEKGDHEAAKKIAALAKTPEKIAEILGSSQRVRPAERGKVEAAFTQVKKKSVKPSPFKRQ